MTRRIALAAVGPVLAVALLVKWLRSVPHADARAAKDAHWDEIARQRREQFPPIPPGYRIWPEIYDRDNESEAS